MNFDKTVEDKLPLFFSLAIIGFAPSNDDCSSSDDSGAETRRSLRRYGIIIFIGFKKTLISGVKFHGNQLSFPCGDILNGGGAGEGL